jgi:hypothetical protein
VARFDPSVIIAAQVRKIRTCAASGREVPAAWDRALQHARDLAAVADWCTKRGISIGYATLNGAGGEWHEDKSMILLEKRTTIRGRLITLLHECGHALIDRSPSEASFRRFGAAHGALVEGASPMDKVNIVSCEIEAWKRGWGLAERLDLALSQEEYEAECVSAVRSYMHWVNSKRRKL